MSLKSNKAASGTTAKRASQRKSVVSTKMAKVDEGALAEVRDRRLQLLEADNYIEEEVNVVNDEAYDNEDEDNEKHKKKKARLQSKIVGAGAMVNRWTLRKNKPLERIVFEQGYENPDVSDDLFGTSNNANVIKMGVFPNYLSINARVSSLPPRKFCSVCGMKGVYRCLRCGMRYCGIKCKDHHEETRCRKIGAF